MRNIKVNVYSPVEEGKKGKKVIVNSASEVLLCETLIVGKVPEVYLNSGTLTVVLSLWSV